MASRVCKLDQSGTAAFFSILPCPMERRNNHSRACMPSKTCMAACLALEWYGHEPSDPSHRWRLPRCRAGTTASSPVGAGCWLAAMSPTCCWTNSPSRAFAGCGPCRWTFACPARWLWPRGIPGPMRQSASWWWQARWGSAFTMSWSPGLPNWPECYSDSTATTL